jgi:hypothetical protein
MDHHQLRRTDVLGRLLRRRDAAVCPPSLGAFVGGPSREPATSRLVAVAVVEEHHRAAHDRQEVLGMCEEWWMWRRHREADEARRLWDEFERTQPVSEPERTTELEVTLEEREATATAAES